MELLSQLKEAVIGGKVDEAVATTEKALAGGGSVREILDKSLIAAMDEVGERYSSGKIFVPQMLRSAKTMHACMDVLKPHLQEGDVTSKGRVVIGTVKADLHDIGKNLVTMMLEGAGFSVVDLGVDVSPDKFVQGVQEESADILGMSALLSTTMPSMTVAVEALEKAGIRDQVKVLIGGAPVTDKFAQQIKADAYAPDAGTAVATAKKLMGL